MKRLLYILLLLIFFANSGFHRINKKLDRRHCNIPPIEKDAYSKIVEEKKIVVVIASYNNEKYLEKNLKSLFKQNYSNYRLIYIDDCSSDNTFEKVVMLINKVNQNHRATLMHNKARHKAMENYYRAIYSCEDDEIVVILDGDDWFANDDVLRVVNYVYSTSDTWITYGNYVSSRGHSGFSKPIQVFRLEFRSSHWVTSHLRTFYAKLFKQVNVEDFFYDNKFVEAAYDVAMMLPMVEMSWGHVRFISNVLYIYNDENLINDHKNGQRPYQKKVHDYIKNELRIYPKLEKLF